MSRPHPALIDVAAGRMPGRIENVNGFVRSAIEHRMAGLVLSSAKAGHIELGAPALRAISATDLVIRAHHEELWQSLENVTAHLSQAGFEIGTFKGVTAEARWYDRPGERPCIDLDLLVAPYDRQRIEEILSLFNPRHPLLPHIRQLAAENRLQAIDVVMAPAVSVDLHLDLFRIGLAARTRDLIWERMVPFQLRGGATVSVPDAETSLVHLLLHLNRDGFPFVLGLVDVVRLVAREGLDWSFIEELVRREGLEAATFASLDRVSDLLAIPSLRPGSRRRRPRQAVWKRLWPERDALRGSEGRADRRRRELWLPFLARGRRLEAARWWFRRVVWPPVILVDLWHGPGRGPRLWRRAVARLHQTDGRLDPSATRGKVIGASTGRRRNASARTSSGFSR